MSQPIISVENLSKHYHLGQIGATTLRASVERVLRRVRRKNDACSLESHSKDLWALRDVSFEVQRGEVLGIIGRNGAGKSTLLKILSRITEPTTGRAVMRGRVASLLEVGTGFHPELTGRENIFLNGAILGMKKAEIASKFDEIVDFSEVERFIDTPVKRYSSGMYVRLAFAVAAFLEPEILIVDEVLAVGDAAFQKKCLGRMKSVAGQGRTVLFVSHNMDAVLNLCDFGIVLNHGKSVYQGVASIAVETYLSSITRVSKGLADLGDHPGRPSGMPVCLRGIGLKCSSSGEYVNRARTGEDLIFDIHYDTAGGMLDLVQLGVCSMTGQRIFTVGTHLAAEFPEGLKGCGVVECRMPTVSLAAGEYSVTVMIGKKSPAHNVDYVEGAITFHVETADFYGTGRTLLPGQGFMAQQSSWRKIEG